MPQARSGRYIDPWFFPVDSRSIRKHFHDLSAGSYEVLLISGDPVAHLDEPLFYLVLIKMAYYIFSPFLNLWLHCQITRRYLIECHTFEPKKPPQQEQTSFCLRKVELPPYSLPSPFRLSISSLHKLKFLRINNRRMAVLDENTAALHLNDPALFRQEVHSKLLLQQRWRQYFWFRWENTFHGLPVPFLTAAWRRDIPFFHQKLCDLIVWQSVHETAVNHWDNLCFLLRYDFPGSPSSPLTISQKSSVRHCDLAIRHTLSLSPTLHFQKYSYFLSCAKEPHDGYHKFALWVSV